MNFFDAQDKARRASKWLVFVYIVATVLIVAGVTLVFAVALGVFSDQAGYQSSDAAGFLATIAIITLLVIVGATLVKTAILSSGGSKVATALGGTLVPTDVADPLRRRLRNVVEEMAIASGVPVPDIYVLEEESSINAFAAGYTPADAAVAVTRGTLELLDRDELQGVIAHEFSHILNGDMRLNIRMMGVLFGIMVISLIGRMILRGGARASSFSRRDNKGAAAIMAVGLGLAVIGFVGMFFARVIKAAVSRQREYLADASAVQFTRQSAGIANALKKIGGYSEASYITETDPEEVSHMLFGSGAKFFGWFATHPPLTERIQALDPSFTGADYPQVEAMAGQAAAEQETMAAFAARAGQAEPIPAAVAAAGEDTIILPESITDAVGHPDLAHVAYAKVLRQSIPESLYDAAHSAELSYLLTLSLVLDSSGQHLERQMNVIEERMGANRARLVRGYYDDLTRLGPEYRLPLLEISFPALKHRPAPQLTHLLELTHRIIEVDGDVNLYEFCFYRILMVNLGHAIDPSGRGAAVRGSKKELRQAAVNVLAIVADHGHDDAGAAQAALDAGLALFGEWAQGVKLVSKQELTVDILDHNLNRLLTLNGKGRNKLLRAVSETAAHDGRLTATEGQLIRVICATLECPLPPILANA